ncbi:MAG: hypothetical protein ACTSPD_18370 [Promethearchaeota archaeon]
MSEDNDLEINKSEHLDNSNKEDFALDFSTSSAISSISLKFLFLYIPIFWFGGILAATYLYAYFANVENWILSIIFLPMALISIWFLFVFGCLLFTKLLLIFINLIHKPKEGIFRAEKGNTDFEFWRLRIELKKIGVWLMNQWPLPWMDSLAFRWFGVKMDFSSHLQDAWVDVEFIKFGRKVMVGQGAVVMSSMVVGKYLIIKKVIFDDYAIIGGQATVAPGTIIGKDTILGACTSTTYNQILEPGWIYFGIPPRKLKPNKYAETRTEAIIKKDVDEEKKFEIQHDINIDEDKKELAKLQEEEEGN